MAYYHSFLRHKKGEQCSPLSLFRHNIVYSSSTRTESCTLPFRVSPYPFLFSMRPFTYNFVILSPTLPCPILNSLSDSTASQNNFSNFRNRIFFLSGLSCL